MKENFDCYDDPIIGDRYGKLVVIKVNHFYVKPSDGKRERRYLCQCDCGGHTVTAKRKLQTGHTSSCGCVRASRSGRSTEPTYNTWNLMVQRCTNHKFTKYEQYGARGINVCSRWSGPDGYENFVLDMGEKPSEKHTIERIDVDGDYCPSNCVWTDDASLQGYNQTIRKSNSSGKTGVAFDVSKGKWIATLSKKPLKLKAQFSTFEAAAKQRDEWELEYYGFNKK